MSQPDSDAFFLRGIATRVVAGVVLVFFAAAACTAYLDHETGLTERACVEQGLTPSCEQPR